MQFLFMIFVVVASISATSALKVRITQTNAVIDATPIINLSEVHFFYNGVQQVVSNAQFQFSEVSSGFPEYFCNDGITVSGTAPYNMPYNMCKSANTNPAGQSLTISMGSTPFNQVVIYNAYGFNNPTGSDVGNRMKGATIDILTDAGSLLYADCFPSSLFQVVYTFIYPQLFPLPTNNPTYSPTVPTPTPTTTKKPSLPPVLLMGVLGKSPAQSDAAFPAAATDDMALPTSALFPGKSSELLLSDDLAPPDRDDLGGQNQSS